LECLDKLADTFPKKAVTPHHNAFVIEITAVYKIKELLTFIFALAACFQFVLFQKTDKNKHIGIIFYAQIHDYFTVQLSNFFFSLFMVNINSVCVVKHTIRTTLFVVSVFKE